MATVLTDATREAGVKLPPLNKRVWLWLHDHPGKTSRMIATAINEPLNNVSSALGTMQKRGMVRTERVSDTRGRNTTVLHYFAVGKEYTLLPMRKVIKTVDIMPAPVPEATPAPAPEFSVDATLNKLPVRHAYAPYVELKKMFDPASHNGSA